MSTGGGVGAGGADAVDGASADASAPAGVDVPRVTAWLEGVLADLVPPLEFSRIGDGRSNLTYRVTDAAGGAWIMRRPPLGPRLRGAHDMAREHRLLAGLHPMGVRVPATFGLCEDDDVTGAPFYVMALARGPVVTDAAGARALSPAARAASGPSLVTALAELHAVDVDAAGLGDLSRHEGYAQRQLKTWNRQWEASRTREIPAIERTAARLAAAVPVQRRTSVVHGDYKLENVVLGDDGEVRAILDWELCTLGDPVADLGTMLTYWAEPGDPVALALGGAEAPTLVDGFCTRAELVEAYARATGDPLDGLDFHRSLAAWKLAIIVQGVVRRFRDTPENANSDPDALDPVIDGLAAHADEIAATL